MTPLQISIALHYHYSPVDFRDGDFSAPAVKEALNYFVANEMLNFDYNAKQVYSATPRLDAYIEKLCSINLPKLMWTYEGK